MKKIIYIVMGVLCIVIGSIGVVLPILPTTPFLLGAAFCFASSSERLSNWFKETRLYKTHLETLNRGEGMTRRAKRNVLISVTIVMGFAEFFMLRAYFLKGATPALIGCIVMAVIWVAHIIAFCFVVKTCTDKTVQEPENESEAYLYDAE